MKNMFYLMTLFNLFFVSTILVAQNKSLPVVVNPSIGDTLSLSERDYYQMLPKIEGFQFAVFYLNPDSTLNADVHYIKNGISADTLIQDYKSLKSLYYHINARNALENKSYLTIYEDKKTKFDKGAYVSVYTNDGGELDGELLSVRRNSLLILKQELKSNVIKSEWTDNINRTEINEVLIKGKSNLGLGIGLGILASVIVGAIIFQSYDDGTFMWGYDAITPTILAMVGCISLGAIIGISTSTPNEIINPRDKYEYQRLIEYSRYKYSEPDELKKIQ